MSEEVVLYETIGNIAKITINRPSKYNALNNEVRASLSEKLKAAEDDPHIRVVILTGAGEKAFAAGADITGFVGIDSKTVRPHVEMGQSILTFIESMSKPVIAAINGFALGGGCEIAMACDIRYASANAKFGQPEIKLGVIPGYGGSVRLPRLVGLGRAKELVFVGDNISAEEAYRIGLVNRVFDSIESLMEGTMELANTLAIRPGVALKLAKQSLNNSWEIPLSKNLEFEVDAFCETFDTEDKEEGVDAFLNKREAKFQHK